jgi:hypothetical protein
MSDIENKKKDEDEIGYREYNKFHKKSSLFGNEVESYN